MIRSFIALLVMLGSIAASPPAEQYVVSPKSSAEIRADVAAGKAPPHGFPVIVNVHWSATNVHPGNTVEATVTTSPNVNYVEGRYKDWSFPFEPAGTGRFQVAYKVPWLPPFLTGHWKIDVIARSIDGVEVRRSFDFAYNYF